MKLSREIKFEAVLEKGDRALGWTIARVPFDPTSTWGNMVRLRVQGEINGFPFRKSLFPEQDRPGSYYLLINRAMQKGGSFSLGQRARFTLQPDPEPRPAELPEELDSLLDEAEGLRDWYGTLTEYTRREIGKWIAGVKTDEARMRRAQQTAERLLATMEAEVELPPLIQRAFQQRPDAHAGRAKMSAERRRGELLAVFYYQSPESRQKRLDKLCAFAESKAGESA